jgi:glycogen operon protein
VAQLATRIAGSADLYQQSRHPYSSINFLTSHDGFTLYDLMSYNEKHNEANGERNRDGCNHNISWNSGAEGETKNPAINALRLRRIRTAAVLLMLSQGVPMFVAGDEFGRTQHGNNNAWCQDNETGWVDWRLASKNRDLLRFFRLLIALRQHHAAFRRRSFFPPPGADNREEIFWQSTEPGRPDWSPAAKTLAFHLAGSMAEPPDHDFVVLLNSHPETRIFQTPTPPRGTRWHCLIDTAAAPPRDIVPEYESRPLAAATVAVAAFGAVVLVAR